MAVTRTAKGTAEEKGPSLPWTAISSIAIAEGASLITGWRWDDRVGAFTGYTLEWNSVTLVKEIEILGGTVADKHIVGVVHNASGATGNLVADRSDANNFEGIAVWATQLEGLEAAPLDKTSSAVAASGTVADSGVTATTAQADEFLVGHLGIGEDDNAPPFTSTGDCTSTGQSIATSGGGGPPTEQTVQETYATVSATGAYDNVIDPIASKAWDCSILTYKIAADTAFGPTQHSSRRTVRINPLLRQ